MFTYRLADDRWLRLTQESDAEELYEVVQANREMLAEWMPWAAGTTVDTIRDFLRQSVQRYATNSGFDTMIVQDDRIVGSIGYPAVNRPHRSCEIGYWLAKPAQGRGTITLAVRALIDHAFGSWDLHRVVIRAGTGNARSRAVAQRLGFTLEGTEREAERFADDRYIDLAVYSMLASEWPAARPG